MGEGGNCGLYIPLLGVFPLARVWVEETEKEHCAPFFAPVLGTILFGAPPFNLSPRK